MIKFHHHFFNLFIITQAIIQEPAISLDTPIPPPPPISLPVYSLAAPLSHDSTPVDGRTTSMNIVTFATAVSVVPPKLWIISLYTNTLTKHAFLTSKIGVLQLLDKRQKDLVCILGKKSGYDQCYCKREECDKAGFGWVANKLSHKKSSEHEISEESNTLCQSLELLPKCQSYLKVKLIKTMEAGDHEVALCQVIGVGKWDDILQCVVDINDVNNEELDPLYTGYLRKEGII